MNDNLPIMCPDAQDAIQPRHTRVMLEHHVRPLRKWEILEPEPTDGPLLPPMRETEGTE